MDSFEKALLLGSLSFFFGCLAVSLIFVNANRNKQRSYMYSPVAEINSPKPVAGLPESVLQYTRDDLTKSKTVDCYLESAYGKLIEERGITLAASAEMGEDKLEIYTDGDSNFYSFVIGPDAADMLEACEVANGTNWKPAR